ncbi:MAG: DUF971 domain-containing protein [Acidobacteria bacterium]|nr:DUF971 domain-containing protein [Acidobacteriota bacterium]
MLSQINRSPVEINAGKSSPFVEIVWDDDHRSKYQVGQLRAICPCATCRETKGENPHQAIKPKTPNPKTEQSKRGLSLPLFKPEKYQITNMNYVGNYALGVEWQDNHHSIFTWRLLSEECPCESCLAERNSPSNNNSSL